MRQQQSLSTLVWILLIIILVIAAGLRFYNLNWDNGTFAHPDERSTVAFYAPTIRWPEDISTLFEPRASTLNPFWDVNSQSRRGYTYGHFPLYLLVFTAHVFNDIAQLAGSLPWELSPATLQFLNTSLTTHGFARIGRGLMALSDVFSVLLIFLLGKRLYGVWGGLLAAALSTFTVLQVQLAHFFAVDPMSATFTLLAIYGAMLLYDRHSLGAAVLTGVGIGLAVASKFSALPIAAAPIMAGYLATRHHAQNEIDAAKLTTRMIGLALLSLAVSFVVFAITSPFVLLDFENFKIAVLDEQGNMVSGMADLPFTRQYRNTWPYVYFIWQQLRWGMGWPLGLLALAGTIWAIVKAVRGKALAGEWIILGWIALYFIPTGLFLAKFMRYMIPVVPLFTLFGAGLVVALWNYKSGESANQRISESNIEEEAAVGGRWSAVRFWHWEKFSKTVALSLAVVGLGGAMFWTLAFVNGVYGTEHTWVTFARWVYANVPDGSCIAWEHWDDRMPANIPEPGGTPDVHGYTQPQLPMYEEDNAQKYEMLRATLTSCDYVVLASNRLSRTIPGLPERYPMSSRYYEALFSGELGFEEIYSVETPPQLGPFVFPDQDADESFTVYDHPKPILFEKTRQLTLEEWDDILGDTWQSAKGGYVGPPTFLTRLKNMGRGSPPASQIAQDDDESLLFDTPVDRLPSVDDFRWNTLAKQSTIAATLIWWLAVMLIGFLTLPVTFLLFHKLPDRGYALGKSLGLLLVGYFVWLNSSLGLLKNTGGTAVVGLIILLGFSLWIAFNQRYALHRFWRQKRWLILVSEVIFLLVFLFFVRLRVLNPDLWQPWQGGEKMLEIGFLNAIVKSATMPPYDPFFAGGVMNYYYYGMFLVGLLSKLTGIQPSIAFNLAVPMLAGLTAINVFSLAGNLALGSLALGSLVSGKRNKWRYVGAGLLGILFVVFIGNLEGAGQFLRELSHHSTTNFESAIPGLETMVRAITGLGSVIGGDRLVAYNFWDPTRVIPATINEFPYFSFIFADLHPHMIGLPFTALFLSLVYHWLKKENQQGSESTSQRGSESTDRQLIQPAPATPPNNPRLSTIHNLQFTIHNSQFSSFVRWFALPFVLGAIGVINTWDLPTYFGLIVMAFILNQYRQTQGPISLPQAGLVLLRSGAFAIVLLVVTYLLYLPFFANYHPPSETGLGLVHTKTPFDQHFKIWGFFLVVLVSWLVVSLVQPQTRHSLLRGISLHLRHWKVMPHLYEIYRTLVKRPSDWYQAGWWGLLAVFIIAALLFLLGFTVPGYLLPLVALVFILLLRRNVPAETGMLNLLAFTGLLVLLGVEFFFLRDFLGGGEYYRMNTLFKFYIQVWVMFGIAAAAALPRLWQRSRYWPLQGQILWQAAMLILLLATLIYPLLATRTRVNDRFPGNENRPPVGTLDGLAYMTTGTFVWENNPIELKYDYEAIRWLQDNVSGTPIIAEAKVGYYREGGMRVAAYTGLPSILGGLHQGEQRPPWQVGRRDMVVNEFWNSPDPARTLALLDQLNIAYVYVGQIERATHGQQVGNKFDQLVTQGKLSLVFENEKTKIYRRAGQ